VVSLSIEAQGFRVKIPTPHHDDVVVVELIAQAQVPLLGHRYLTS